jgi:hypothetical protein
MSQWLHCDQLEQAVAGEAATAYLQLPKMRWLSPVQCTAQEPTLRPQDLPDLMAQHFSEDSYPLLIAALDGNRREYRRFFVTHNQWPDEAPERDETAP